MARRLVSTEQAATKRDLAHRTLLTRAASSPRLGLVRAAGADGAAVRCESCSEALVLPSPFLRRALAYLAKFKSSSAVWKAVKPAIRNVSNVLGASCPHCLYTRF